MNTKDLQDIVLVTIVLTVLLCCLVITHNSYAYNTSLLKQTAPGADSVPESIKSSLIPEHSKSGIDYKSLDNAINTGKIAHTVNKCHDGFDLR